MPVPNLLNGKLCCICLKSCLRSGKCGQVCKSLLFIFMGPGYIQMMLRLGRHCGACSERPRVGMFIHIFKKDWQEAIGECVYIYTKVKALVFLRCLDGMQHVLSCMPYNLDLLKVIVYFLPGEICIKPPFGIICFYFFPGILCRSKFISVNY